MNTLIRLYIRWFLKTFYNNTESRQNRIVFRGKKLIARQYHWLYFTHKHVPAGE